MKILPFDSHNHAHMGPTPAYRALLSDTTNAVAVQGMAIMSTHTRDFETVGTLRTDLSKQYPVEIIAGYGIHPWFLHELSEDEWKTDPVDSLPLWLKQMEERLLADETSIVGEIGLDGFHFDPRTEELVSPMERQIEAFEMQMRLASRLQRPVSVHAVQCFGQLMQSLSKLKKSNDKLPPKIYFHAFGGKEGTIDQLLALCGREQGKVYFGFAPVINLRSPKTAGVAKKIGLERLLLETDHEDSQYIPESIVSGIKFLSETFGMAEEEVIEATTRNAADLYTLKTVS